MLRRVWWILVLVVVLSPTAVGFANWRAAGSGFIVDQCGYILTNAHVVQDAVSIKVKVNGGFHSASVIEVLEDTDLALLKISGCNWPYVQVGDSSKVQLLDPVIAMGYPLSFQFGQDLSVSQGQITAFRTKVLNVDHPFQHDAVIAHGSSGGPLLNLYGEVIGVNFAGDEGLLYAIPIGHAEPLFEHISGFVYPPRYEASRELSPADIVSRNRDAVVYIEVDIPTAAKFKELVKDKIWYINTSCDQSSIDEIRSAMKTFLLQKSSLASSLHWTDTYMSVKGVDVRYEDYCFRLDCLAVMSWCRLGTAWVFGGANITSRDMMYVLDWAMKQGL